MIWEIVIALLIVSPFAAALWWIDSHDPQPPIISQLMREIKEIRERKGKE